MASASSYQDSGERFGASEMQKAIQQSIYEVDRQTKMAEEISEQKAISPEDLDDDEQIRLATELSLQEFHKSQSSSTTTKSFYDKHFDLPEQEVKLRFEDPDQIYEDQFKIAQKRKNAEERKPFDRDLRLAIEQSKAEAANPRYGLDTRSDFDSGLVGEDSELELALKKSRDPYEQESHEQMELLLVLQLSERESSSLEFSSQSRKSPIVDFLSSSQDSNDPGLWLFEGRSESNRQRIQDLFSSSSSSGSSSQELNDQILLKQLEQDMNSPRQSLTAEQLEYLQPFIKPAVAANNTITDVKSLDEIEEEYKKSRQKKNSRKSPNSGSASIDGLSKQGSSSNQFRNSHLYPDLRDEIVSDKPSPRSSPKLSAFSAVSKKSRSPIPSNGFYDNLSMSERNSPRKSPDMTCMRSILQTDKSFNSPKKSSTNLVSYSGAAKRASSANRNGYSVQEIFAAPDFGQTGNSGYRPIIVDGCNVAFQHGKNDRFSAKGLLIIYNYFVSRFGYTNENITIVNKPGGKKTPEDMAILDMLYKIDVLVNTVSSSTNLHVLIASNLKVITITE